MIGKNKMTTLSKKKSKSKSLYKLSFAAKHINIGLHMYVLNIAHVVILCGERKKRLLLVRSRAFLYGKKFKYVGIEKNLHKSRIYIIEFFAKKLVSLLFAVE